MKSWRLRRLRVIHELMDLAWNVVYDLLQERELLGDGLFVEEFTGYFTART
ncbi:hypothetical protein LFT45_17740 [Arthrobacter sp. FW305-BF8]|uniref:hypothetical protein n=1 Tax=Arthrobacter sp. FW305-BF8 TaxID=2879617 RepID=UPI001F467353|nr:hypothetical protein [Arthrobacter sp. FW305-BF8]UKA53539.1 hypothetical protein LFT45_17740 [Arthrobacter sp. FW305-BF8]